MWVSCSDIQRKHKDGIPRLLFPGTISVAYRCVPNLNSAPKAHTPGQANRPFSQRGQGCASSAAYSGPQSGNLPRISLSNCYSPLGPRNASSPGYQSQAIKRFPLGSSHKNQGNNVKTGTPDMYTSSPPRHVRTRNVAEGEFKDSACPSEVLGKVDSQSFNVYLIKSLPLGLQL